MAKYQRRYKQRTRLTNLNLSGAVQRQAERDAADIANKKEFARQSREVAKDLIKGKEQAFAREQSWSQKLQSFEDKAFYNAKTALGIRADREVGALRDAAKEQAESLKWLAPFSSTIAKSVGGALSDIYEESRMEEMRKNYKAADYTKWNFGYAVNEEQYNLMRQANAEMWRDKNFDPKTKADTIIDLTNKSGSIAEEIPTQDLLDNKDIFISSTKKASIDSKGKDLWKEDIIEDLLLTRLHFFMQHNGIRENSESGAKLIRTVRTWARDESNQVRISTEGLATIDELNAGGLSIRASIRKGTKEGIDQAGIKLNSMALIARGRVIPNGDIKTGTFKGWIEPKEGGFMMSIPDAFLYNLPYIMESNKDMTWDDIELILKNTKVPKVGKYEKTKEENLPTWYDDLKDRGYIDPAKKVLEKGIDKEGKDKETAKNVQAATDLKNLTERINNPDSVDEDGNPNYINMNDYSLQGGRSIVTRILNSETTHQSIKDGLWPYIDIDGLYSATKIEENFRAALETTNLDDESFWYSRMQKKDQEKWFSRHKVMRELFTDRRDMEKQVKDELKTVFKSIYKDGYKSDRDDAIIERLADKGWQQFMHYANRLSDKEVAGDAYEPNVATRIETIRSKLVKEIIDGEGLWSREEPGKGGSLRIKWTHQESGRYYEADPDISVKDYFKNTFGTEYDAKKIADSVSPKVKNTLLTAAISGNAEGVRIPDIVLGLREHFKGSKIMVNGKAQDITLRRIINDLMMKTHDDDSDIEVEWPAGIDDLTVLKTKNGYKYANSNEINVEYAISFNAFFGQPLMRKELINIYMNRGKLEKRPFTNRIGGI